MINTQLNRQIKLKNFKQPKLIRKDDAFQLHGGFDHFSKYYPSEILIRYNKTDQSSFNPIDLNWAKALGRVEHVFDFLNNDKIIIGLGKHGDEIFNDFNIIDFKLKSNYKIWKEEVNHILPSSGCSSYSNDKYMFI